MNHNTQFEEAIHRVVSKGGTVLDIASGLRCFTHQGNRFSLDRAWIAPLLKKVDYKALDPVDTYHPDIVGDVQALPLADESVDSIICMSVLEHVPNPILAMQEMHRVLKPGGILLVQVPFLRYYHGEPGYYGDFWRFTPDTLKFLGREFSATEEITSNGGRFSALVKLTPLVNYEWGKRIGRILDRLFPKKTRQVVGWQVVYVK